MTDAVQPVTPLTRISGPSGLAIARLGAIAIDENRRLLGLTARHILFCDPSSEIIDIDTGDIIGRRIDWPYTEKGSHRFVDTIAAFELTTDAVMATTRRAINSYVQFDECLGRSVFKLSDKSDNPRGEVTGVGGVLRFNDPYARSSEMLRDYIEVRFRRARSDNASPGDAGSLIIDDCDAAVGLLMGGDAERAFVAPIEPFLNANNLILAPARADALRATASEMGLEIQQARSGQAQLRRDLDAELQIHDDPGGGDVPERLLRLMGQA